MKRYAVVGFLVFALLAVCAPTAQAQSNGTTLAASKTLDICLLPSGNWRYSGEISVWNEGVLDTIGLAINDCIQNKTGKGQYKNAYCTTTFAPAVPPTEIPAGTSLETATVFKYTIEAAPLSGDIRNNADVSILNHSGSLGKPKGPSPSFTYTGARPPAPCPTEQVCVRSQGYWKTHNDVWPDGYDSADSFFLSGNTWQYYLANPGGNAYNILAVQYIGAVLNKANGAAVPAGVQAILDQATAWFTANAPSACPAANSCGTQKTWAGILESYNTGSYEGGPAHCVDIEP